MTKSFYTLINVEFLTNNKNPTYTYLSKDNHKVVFSMRSNDNGYSVFSSKFDKDSKLKANELVQSFIKLQDSYWMLSKVDTPFEDTIKTMIV